MKVAFLKENGLPVPDAGTEKKETHGGGCPGSRTITFQNTVSGDYRQRIVFDPLACTIASDFAKCSSLQDRIFSWRRIARLLHLEVSTGISSR